MSATSGVPNPGAAWLRRAGKTLSPFGEQVAAFMEWWLQGIYHAQGDMLRADWSGEGHVTFTMYSSGWCTFDGADLTRLVIGAHERGIRMSVEPAGPHRLRLRFHPRRRDGAISERHPTIEDAVATVRAWTGGAI